MRISDWSSDVCSSDLWTREFLGEVFVGLAADHLRHVRRPEKAIDPHCIDVAHYRRLQDVADRRWREHVIAQDAEVADAACTRELERGGGRRRGGLEAEDRKSTRLNSSH